MVWVLIVICPRRLTAPVVQVGYPGAEAATGGMGPR